MISFDCASCGATLRVGDDKAGKSGKCTECGGIITIPSAPGPLPASGPDDQVSKQHMEPTPWDADWKEYYRAAEAIARNQFNGVVKPALGEALFKSFDMSVTLDFACGYGRFAEILAPRCGKLICCDIKADSIDYCRRRFANHPSGCQFEFVVNDLDGIALSDEMVTFVYSWDAMVHFNKELLDRYFREFYRVMKKGGRGFAHHSNYCGLVGPKDTIWNDNPHCRASVSAQDAKEILEKCGFKVLAQTRITWAHDVDLDCISVFEK